MNELSTADARRRNRALDFLPEVEKLCLDGDGRFPSVVQTLWKMFNDDTILESPKGDHERVKSETRAKIGFELLKLSALGKQVEQEKGLLKSAKKTETHNHLTIFNFTTDQWQALPPIEREVIERLRLRAASEVPSE